MLARAEAISRRQYVAVIMPGNTIVQPSDDTNVYKYQAFRSAFVEPSTADNDQFIFVEWVPGTQWTFLPNAALIALVNDDAAKTLTLDANGNTPLGHSSYSDIKAEDGAGIPTVVDGTSEKLMPGTGVDNTTGIRAVVFKPNGRCTHKCVITVMEGQYTASSTEIERENTSNIRVLDVNKFTGQVKFLF